MLNSIYCECTFPLWNYYFQLNDLKYKPVVLFGEISQLDLCKKLKIEFYSRTDFINLDIKVEYSLNTEEIEIFNNIKADELLLQMYKRFSVDSFPNRTLCEKLTEEYLKVWLCFIKRHKIDALILFEMPHIPYSYIGYKLFNYLNKTTLFSSTLPFSNKSFWFRRIENYSLFNKYSFDEGECKVDFELQSTALDDLKKLMPQSHRRKSKYVGFLAQALICLRNILLPSRSTMRQYFKLIRKNAFILISDRYYYLRQLQLLINKALIKKYFKKLSSNFSLDDGKRKYLYALHFEPEMAVVPMAGEFYNQLEVIRIISNLLEPEDILYVKEHPWTFDYTKYQSVVRDRWFYDQIASLKNVRLVSIGQSTAEILDSIECTFTLTGTVGWEAFLKGKKVVCFGNTWYEGLPNIYRVKNINTVSSVKNFLNQELLPIDFYNIRQILMDNIFDVSVKMKCENEFEYFNKSRILKKSIELA